MAAACYLIDNYPIPFFESFDIGAGFFNDTYHLMSNNARIDSGSVCSMIDADIRSADTGCSHPYKNIIYIIDVRPFQFQ